MRAEDVVEDELGEEEFVCAVDLASDFAFELNTRGIVDEVKILEDLDALLVIGKKLQILVGHELSELGDVFLDNPLIMTHRELKGG